MLHVPQSLAVLSDEYLIARVLTISFIDQVLTDVAVLSYCPIQ